MGAEMTAAETIAAGLQHFGFPDDAQAFLLKVWDVAQFLDDVQDDEPPDKALIYTLAVGFPCDPFLQRWAGMLAPLLATMYHKWHAANVVEASGDSTQLDKAYMWRAGYYDVVLAVAGLCFPRERVEELAPQVLALYGESRDEYLKEFTHA
jgi:hypothetical protein